MKFLYEEVMFSKSQHVRQCLFEQQRVYVYVDSGGGTSSYCLTGLLPEEN